MRRVIYLEIKEYSGERLFQEYSVNPGAEPPEGYISETLNNKEYWIKPVYFQERYP